MGIASPNEMLAQEFFCTNMAPILLNETGEHQGVAVMNYPDESVPHTRISEHKHFAPWEHNRQSIVFVEQSFEAGPEDIPYYSRRLPETVNLLARYEIYAAQESNVSFLARLGTYRYLNMDKVIAESARLFSAVFSSK